MRSFVTVLLAISLAGAAAATAPTISAVGASPVNDTWAQINWTTNISANSYVDFGLTAGYGTTEYVSGYVTAHKVQMNNLTAGTTYHYRIRTGNSSGEYTTSGDYTLTTGAATYGCESNPTGEPIGGGTGYSRTIDSAAANYIVSTASALKSALSSATSGQIVYVADDARIDLSGQTASITIKSGVTLASGRGRNGSLGGLIYSDTFTQQLSRGWFATGGTGVRITGLRIMGPFNGPWRTNQEYHGIYVGHAGCEIDNCEWFGWNYSDLEVLLGSNACTPYFHHNYIHHNTKLGCGYGICPGFNAGDAVPVVEGNIFDFERHSVASHGTVGMSYEARYNLVLEHSISHVFDMHGGTDRGDGTTTAGTIMRIHHNTVRNVDQGAVCIRGLPSYANSATRAGCWINNNHFFREDDSWCIRQLYDTGRFYESNNQFGVETGTILGKWNFNEGQGSTAYDGTGNNNDATLTNMNTATCWVEGHEGQGLKFLDGTDYVDCGSYFTQTDNIVFDCWAKFDSLPLYMEVMNNGVFDIYYRGGTAGSYMWFRVKITNSSVYPGDSWWYGYAAVKGTTELATGQWYHFVGVRSGDTLRLYTNGVLDRELSCLGGYTINTAGQTDLKIGSGVAGTIDEASVYRLDPAGGAAPTLTWTGEGDYSDGGVYPKLATTSDFLTFKVKYADADGDEPKLGYPKLHIRRHGVEFEYLTPVVMSAVDTAAVASGRTYQYQVRMPRGLDYSYWFEAQDAGGRLAVGRATEPTTGPCIATGNNAPVLYYATNDSTKFIENVVYPSSGNTTTSFDIRAAYMDRDGDPPLDGYPKARILDNGTEITGSPFTMTAMETTTDFWDRRNYQLLKRLPAGTAYTVQVIAYDSQGTAAVALPDTPEARPDVTEASSMWCDIFTGSTNPNPSLSFPVSVMFGQTTSDFVQGDVTVTNGTISGFTGSGAFYTFTVTATAAGTVTVNVPAGACTGTAGSNTASNTLSIVCSSTGASTLSNLVTTVSSNPYRALTFDVEAWFSQAVTGFVASDVSVTNGSVSGFTGSGSYYAFNVTATTEGTVAVIIPAGVTSPGNTASATLSKVCYPPTGAGHIWVGHGYSGSRLGTYTDPFDLMADGLDWLKDGGTLHVFSGSNPETIRITRPLRIESYNGAAKIGAN